MTSRTRTTFRTIPLSRIIEQVNGPPRPIVVYDFGSVEKYEREDLPGQVYFWLRGVRTEDE